MNTQNLLIGALAVQVGLAAITWWPRGAEVVEPTLLVPSGHTITELTILGKGEGKAPVTLASTEGTWRIRTAHDYPADADKVAEVITALGKVQLRTPIATQASSHEGLGVTNEAFERKVTVEVNGTRRELLVGAAASNAVHVRLDGGDDVWQVKGLSAFALKDEARGYLPANHLDLDKDAVTSLSISNALGSVALVKGEAGWTVEGAEGVPANSEAVDGLLEKFNKVRLSEVVGQQVEPSFGLTEGATRLTWAVTQGEETSAGGLVIGAEKDGKFYIKTDDSPFVVLSPTYRLKDVVSLDPATLVAAPAGPEAVAP